MEEPGLSIPGEAGNTATTPAASRRSLLKEEGISASVLFPRKRESILMVSSGSSWKSRYERQTLARHSGHAPHSTKTALRMNCTVLRGNRATVHLGAVRGGTRF